MPTDLPAPTDVVADLADTARAFLLAYGIREALGAPPTEPAGAAMLAARDRWTAAAHAVGIDSPAVVHTAARIAAHYLAAAELDAEPTDAGPLVCAECGTSTAESYVVTFLDGDQEDPTGRTEVCLPCHDALDELEEEGRAEVAADDAAHLDDDETAATGGRCDTCGAPSTPDGCTRDRGHAVALDVVPGSELRVDDLTGDLYDASGALVGNLHDGEAEPGARLAPTAVAVAAAHRYTVPLGAGAPPFCSCGVTGGNGINRPLLADHLRDVGHPDFA